MTIDYSPFEHHVLPNRSEVWYRDSDHAYFGKVQKKGDTWTGVQAARLPSPSTIAKYADPNPDNLMNWAARKELEGVILLGDVTKYGTARELAEALAAKKLTWRHLRDAKGDTGTAVHDAFEKGLQGVPVPLSSAKPEEQGHLIALDRFFNDHPEIRPLQTEQVVYSREHGYAGRFDARVTMNLEWDEGITRISTEGASVLLDLKTSGYIGRAYHAQLHGYDLAAEECGIGASDRLLILQTRVEGTYTLWPCRSSREAFLHALALYNAGKECDRETRADYRELAA